MAPEIWIIISVCLWAKTPIAASARLGLFNSSSNAANYQMWEELRLGFFDTIGGTPGDRRDLNNDADLVNDWSIVPQEFGVCSNFMERDRSQPCGGFTTNSVTSLPSQFNTVFLSLPTGDAQKVRSLL